MFNFCQDTRKPSHEHEAPSIQLGTRNDLRPLKGCCQGAEFRASQNLEAENLKVID